MPSSAGLSRNSTVVDPVAISTPRTWAVPRDLVVYRPSPVRTRKRGDRARRILNVAVALIGLIVLSPLMLVIAVLVKLTSPGPIFYTQQRVGLDRRSSASTHFRRRKDMGGRIFRIYKFRTMYQAPPDASQVWARKGDPRITPVGRILRKYRLDELPQLINVLRGDMNVVGPRPEQPEIFEELRASIEKYQERQRILPGITGWAQVNQTYDQCLDDVRRKVEFDLEYTKRQSVTEDLRIMLRTLPVIAFRNDGT
jgi:lipopolysaccharide/colanic/teichoic acid biosynthesis glycosyltransferase